MYTVYARLARIKLHHLNHRSAATGTHHTAASVRDRTYATEKPIMQNTLAQTMPRAHSYRPVSVRAVLLVKHLGGFPASRRPSHGYPSQCSTQALQGRK